jgi:hypothetical protein
LNLSVKWFRHMPSHVKIDVEEKKVKTGLK